MFVTLSLKHVGTVFQLTKVLTKKIWVRKASKKSRFYQILSS